MHPFHHLQSVQHFIRENPVKVRLCVDAASWFWTCREYMWARKRLVTRETTATTGGGMEKGATPKKWLRSPLALNGSRVAIMSHIYQPFDLELLVILLNA